MSTHKERHDQRPHEGDKNPRRESFQFCIRIKGPQAFWGGPTTGPCRYSGFFPSYGAIVGIARSVVGPHEMTWVISEVRLLKMPHVMTETTNHIKSFNTEMYPGTLIPKPVDVNAKRTLRTSRILRDVDYAFFGRIVLTEKALEGDVIEKYEQIAQRRLEKGQKFRPLCLGTSENCRVDLQRVDPSTLPTPVDMTEDFGLQYFGEEYPSKTIKKQYFAELKVEKGILRFPSWEQVRQLGIARTVVVRPS